mmetsp:Transcript_4961/g.13134  ORF Transcript_4961/g.13134 Transcript_4961/m.13134 type:complete len:152 (-) Transcript_4961:988-1443(-)
MEGTTGGTRACGAARIPLLLELHPVIQSHLPVQPDGSMSVRIFVRVEGLLYAWWDAIRKHRMEVTLVFAFDVGTRMQHSHGNGASLQISFWARLVLKNALGYRYGGLVQSSPAAEQNRALPGLGPLIVFQQRQQHPWLCWFCFASSITRIV